MSQYKDPGTPVNGPQAKRRGYLTQQEDEERQQELTKRLLQERLDSDARNKLERERNVIRNAYQAPNPFVEPEVPVPTTTTEPVETFIGTPAIDPAIWAALAEAEAAAQQASGARLDAEGSPSEITEDTKTNFDHLPEGSY